MSHKRFKPHPIEFLTKRDEDDEQENVFRPCRHHYWHLTHRDCRKCKCKFADLDCPNYELNALFYYDDSRALLHTVHARRDAQLLLESQCACLVVSALSGVPLRTPLVRVHVQLRRFSQLPEKSNLV
jgi:hypothetical protein